MVDDGLVAQLTGSSAVWLKKRKDRPSKRLVSDNNYFFDDGRSPVPSSKTFTEESKILVV